MVSFTPSRGVLPAEGVASREGGGGAQRHARLRRRIAAGLVGASALAAHRRLHPRQLDSGAAFENQKGAPASLWRLGAGGGFSVPLVCLLSTDARYCNEFVVFCVPAPDPLPLSSLPTHTHPSRIINVPTV